MIVEAFSGAGGFSEGLRELGGESIGVEFDPVMVSTARAAGHNSIQADVSALDPRELLDGRECKGLIAGPPCPSFSNAGKRLGRRDMPTIHRLIHELSQGVDNRAAASVLDIRSLLTAEPMRWAYLLRPKWIVLEQVPAVLPIWQDIAGYLREMGYFAWTGVVQAERYGVPQTRQRAILLASRTREVGEPVATHRRYYPPGHKLALNPPDAHLPRWVSMADALGMEPGTVIRTRANRRPTGGNTFVADRPSWGLTEKTRSWTVDGIHPDMPASTQALRSDGWPHSRPATTIAGDPRVFPPGGHHVPGAQSHGAIRVSIEEAATLQTFPRDYPWQGARSKQFLMCGNAVPPLLAKAILAEVMGTNVGRINLAAFGI